MNIVNPSELFAKPEVKIAIGEIRRVLRSALPEGSFGERESSALAINDEAVRQLLQEELQTIADELGEEVRVDGEVYKVHEPGTDTYHGLCGPLDVSRATYRQVGVRNGPTVVPLELAAGIVEGATPALAYNVTHGYAQHDCACTKRRFARRTGCRPRARPWNGSPNASGAPQSRTRRASKPFCGAARRFRKAP